MPKNPPPPPQAQAQPPKKKPAGPITVYTQNMQGGRNVGYVNSAIRQYDVTFLQESGRPGLLDRMTDREDDVTVNGVTLTTGRVNFGTSRKPDERFVIHHPNGRCSQLVLINTDRCLREPDGKIVPPTPFVIPAKDPELRPIVGGIVDGLAIGSFHAPSGNPNFATKVLERQIDQAKQFQAFIFGGDANSDITAQQKPGSVKAFASPVPTHQGGGNLDGMVCSVSVSGSPLTPISNTASDHIVGLSGTFHK